MGGSEERGVKSCGEEVPLPRSVGGKSGGDLGREARKYFCGRDRSYTNRSTKSKI